MLSHSRKAVAGLRAPGARLLASKAALVKSLAADQKALADAVVALGPNASYVKVKELSESDPFAATMAKVKAEDLSWTWSMIESSPSKPPVTVCVSGAGTPVGAAALYRIAAGEMLGPDQPVTLNVLGADAAVVKDIEACGFPLLKSIAAAPNGTAAMTGAKYALLLGGDMAELGKAAPKGALVGALGCTNAHAASKAAGAGGASITAITRAPQLAAEVQLASAAGVSPTAVSNVRSSLSPPAHPPPPALLAQADPLAPGCAGHLVGVRDCGHLACDRRGQMGPPEGERRLGAARRRHHLRGHAGGRGGDAHEGLGARL